MDSAEFIRLQITDESLPSEFQNRIINNSEIVIIRSNVKSMLDINEWAKSFGYLTNTKWNCRSSCPSGEKFVCWKKFVCQHSSFHKVPLVKNTKAVSKNADCPASMTIKIKLDKASTRRKDEFICEGLVGVITIYPFHKHSLMTAEALRFPTKDYRNIFNENFHDGMVPTESAKYQSILEMTANFQPSDLVNSRINPIRRTIACKEDVREQLKKAFGEVIDNFDCSVPAMEKALMHLKTITSTGQCENVLTTLGSNVQLKKKAGVAIRGQPTSIACRIGIARGSKRLDCGRPSNCFKASKKIRHNLSVNIKLNQPSAKKH